MAEETNPILQDSQILGSLLRETAAPHLRLQRTEDLRMLDMACGSCNEAEELIRFAASQTQGAVHLVGVDIRIGEILQARGNHDLPAEFLLEDATKLKAHQELGEDFGLVLLRHQNYWNGADLWTRIFEEGLQRAGEDGLVVITSYFDKEHQLALEALGKLGAELVATRINERARKLSTPAKAVDKHLAVLRRRK